VSHAQRERPSTHAFSTRDLRFGPDNGCQGRLYLPDSPTTPPVVVLAPGAGLTRHRTLESTGQGLAERGYAALAFDHRGFGASGDDSVISPARQRADLEAALDTARAAPEVDGDRLAIWGMDLSAGTALAVAADSAAVDAVIARFPVMSGPTLLPNWVRPRLRGLATGLLDYPLSAFGRLRGQPARDRGRRVPLIGDADAVAAVAAAGAARNAREVIGRDPGTTPARSLVKLQRHDVGDRLAAVDSPVLFLAGERDEVAPPDTVAARSESVPDATLVRVQTGHFDALAGAPLDRTLAHELAFLDVELD